LQVADKIECAQLCLLHLIIIVTDLNKNSTDYHCQPSYSLELT